MGETNKKLKLAARDVTDQVIFDGFFNIMVNQSLLLHAGDQFLTFSASKSSPKRVTCKSYII